MEVDNVASVRYVCRVGTDELVTNKNQQKHIMYMM